MPLSEVLRSVGVPVVPPPPPPATDTLIVGAAARLVLAVEERTRARGHAGLADTDLQRVHDIGCALYTLLADEYLMWGPSALGPPEARAASKRLRADVLSLAAATAPFDSAGSALPLQTRLQWATCALALVIDETAAWMRRCMRSPARVARAPRTDVLISAIALVELLARDEALFVVPRGVSVRYVERCRERARLLAEHVERVRALCGVSCH